MTVPRHQFIPARDGSVAGDLCAVYTFPLTLFVDERMGAVGKRETRLSI